MSKFFPGHQNTCAPFYLRTRRIHIFPAISLGLSSSSSWFPGGDSLLSLDLQLNVKWFLMLLTIWVQNLHTPYALVLLPCLSSEDTCRGKMPHAPVTHACRPSTTLLTACQLIKQPYSWKQKWAAEMTSSTCQAKCPDSFCNPLIEVLCSELTEPDQPKSDYMLFSLKRWWILCYSTVPTSQREKLFVLLYLSS